MKDTLDFFVAELQLQISTLSMHIRNHAYRLGTPAHQNALQSLLYQVLIRDELSILLERYERVKTALIKCEAGQEYDLTYEDEPVDIHTYCLYQFEGDHCPLGSSTAELQTWVSTHADRNQQLRQGFETFFPDIKFTIIDDLADELQSGREVTDAEKFENQTESYLRDIVDSNVLTEFNDLMIQIRDLLQEKAPVDSILAALPINDE